MIRGVQEKQIEPMADLKWKEAIVKVFEDEKKATSLY